MHSWIKQKQKESALFDIACFSITYVIHDQLSQPLVFAWLIDQELIRETIHKLTKQIESLGARKHVNLRRK